MSAAERFFQKKFMVFSKQKLRAYVNSNRSIISNDTFRERNFNGVCESNGTTPQEKQHHVSILFFFARNSHTEKERKTKKNTLLPLRII